MAAKNNHRLFWFLLLPLFLFAFVFPFSINGYINPHDDGVWLAAVQALLEGKHLYRDIWLQYNPVLPWLAAQAAAQIAPTLAVIRSTFWVLNALGLLCISAAVFRFIDDEPTRFLALLWLWLVPAAAQFRCIPFSARYGAGFLPFLAWPVEGNGTKPSKNGSAFLAGLLTGAAFWIEQDMGGAALAAGALVFFCRPGGSRGLVRFLVGAGILMTAGAAVVACRDGLSNYIQSAFIQIAQLVHAERLSFPSLGFLRHPIALIISLQSLRAWESLADVLAFYAPILLYGAVLLWSATGSARFRGTKAIAAGLALYGILASSSAWGRTDRWHIYFSVSGGLFLGAYWTAWARKEFPQCKNLVLLLFLITGGMLTLPHLFARQIHDRYLNEVQRPGRLPRLGGVRLPYWQANAYEALADWIDRHTRPGEPILFFPYDGAIFFLTDRPNPCRLPILAYAVTDQMQDSAVREMDLAHVRWIIWDRDDKAFDGIPVERFLSHIYRYIQSHYEPREQLGSFLFLERKP